MYSWYVYCTHKCGMLVLSYRCNMCFYVRPDIIFYKSLIEATKLIRVVSQSWNISQKLGQFIKIWGQHRIPKMLLLSKEELRGWALKLSGRITETMGWCFVWRYGAVFVFWGLLCYVVRKEANLCRSKFCYFCLHGWQVRWTSMCLTSFAQLIESYQRPLKTEKKTHVLHTSCVPNKEEMLNMKEKAPENHYKTGLP